MPKATGARRVADRVLPSWRRETLRTTLWLVPGGLVVLAVVLFLGTTWFDRAIYRGVYALPGWAETGDADAARSLLGTIAAAVLTVVGVVFSVTIVALTLASQQFGPRMLRNFIRDLGTQVTLGAFVATAVYSVLVLGSVSDKGAHGAFVPHVGVTVSLALLVVDLVVLVYFIHHIAVSIQLPRVIAAISKDLTRTIEIHFPADRPGDGRSGDQGGGSQGGGSQGGGSQGGGSQGGNGHAANGHAGDGHDADAALDAELAELSARLEHLSIVVPAGTSGYLQYVRYEQLVDMAAETDTVLELLYRAGHYITAGLPLARVWPPTNAPTVVAALQRAHVAGPQRTLTQDPVFPIDQLVEIAIRALSPAVNDTFTALTCIDWLADGLCRVSERSLPTGVHRDANGQIRLLEPPADYARIVNRASDKIRQASREMPAVAVRQMDGLTKVVAYTRTQYQREVLARQADRILRASEESIPDPDDRRDVAARHAMFVTAAGHAAQRRVPLSRTSMAVTALPVRRPLRSP